MNKSQHYKQDPNIEQESQHYDSPIPSREYLMQVMEEVGVPIPFKKLVRLLNIKPEDEKPLKYRLRAMERDGQILKNRRKKYGLAQRMDLIKGTVIGNAEGFGYLETTSQDDKLFIPPHEMQKVLHGDEVMAYVVGQINSKGRQEVAIAEILKRNTQAIVGKIYLESGVTFLKPASSHFTQDVIIPKSSSDLNNQIAEVRITHQPTKHSPPIGEIIEIIEAPNAAALEIQMAIRTFQIPSKFNQNVVESLTHLPDSVTQSDKENRVDLTHLPFITIDGDDSKDFDDAVFAQKQDDGGWTLYVAIADVAHYVQPKSPLDNEAQKRGNSVYFPNHVIPMLPEKLSNHLCSLNPKQDRLALVCQITLDAKGKQQHYKFSKAVIHSHARMTYRDVNKMIMNKQHPLWETYTGIADNVTELNELYKQLKRIRKKRGAITIESQQISISFTDDGQIDAIKPYKIRRSNKIIEECMLLANTCAAHFLFTNDKETLYRIHSEPHSEKVKQLKATLTYLGIHAEHIKTPQPQDFQKIIQETKKTPHAGLVQMAVLRTFKQAMYSPENIGHFGLNFDRYVHFTSPIRRYPDLLVHRSIEKLLTHCTKSDPSQNLEWFKEMGEHCSKTERRADDATREVDLSLKCEYASKHIGRVFKGTITGVMPFGIFVFIEELGLDGLVHVSALKSDYYHFDEVQHQLIGERKGMKFSLGDSVKIKLDRVRRKERKIDFSIA